MTLNTLSPLSLSGQTIKGYELQELIGKGGFGAVYRAYQPAVKREVAIKAILPEYINHPDFIRRFEAEAQLVAHLEHIHIVPLYDYWRDPAGAFLVMRWLRGGSLRGALEKRGWPISDVGRLVDQITAALAAAHRAGVIHRDLKPDNILLDDENNAYLADFGIAKDLQNLGNTLYAAEEQEGAMLGSPYYISPEQIRADPVTPQSDIYSLGIMLYEILTGKIPYHGMPLSTVITKHLNEPLPHLHETDPDLPEALNHVIARATEKDPADRYPSVLALNVDFHQALVLSEGSTLQVASPTTYTPEDLERLGITNELLPDLAGVEPTNPYKGLRAFQEADAEDFYGRETLVEQLLDLFKSDDLSSRFLAVIGPSGSGKSSVVKAGLIPQLRGGAVPGSSDWFIVEMIPGMRPLEELEAALLRVAVNPPASLLAQLKEDERGLVRAIKRVLPDNKTRTANNELLLVIDQFEEAFTLTQDEAERAQFLNILTAAARDPESRLRIIATLRADFYDRPLMYPDFGQLVRESTEVVLPLTREEMERAIVDPAEKAGLKLESGLVTAILVDVAEQPGALPQLQFALTELFERRDGRWLTLTAYREIGGVSGALARRADDLYEKLNEAQQLAARQMFLRLVTLNEGSEDTRRRVRQDELLSLQGDERTMQDVIDHFGKYRLLTFDRDPASRTPTVEVAHEALIRQWGRLREWLQKDREGLRVQRRLTAASEEWLNAGKDPSYLASGSRLDQFEAWTKDTELALTGNEFSFLDASLAERVHQQAEEEARKAQKAASERRTRRLLQALVAVLAVATLGALILTRYALNQSDIADQNAATATFAQGDAIVQANNAATAAAVAQLNADEARGLAFASGAQLALSNNNTDLAILLGMAANRIGQPTAQTQQMLAEAAYAPGTRRVYTGHSERTTSVAISPDGSTIATGSRDKTVILWDAATGEELHHLEGHTDWVRDTVFSPDGSFLLSTSEDNTLILWDVETGEFIRQLTGHTDVVRSVVFSADGTQVLSGSEDNTLILWDVETGELIRQFQAGSPVYDVAMSKTGFTAISGGVDGIITLWNVGTGESLFRYGAESTTPRGEVWSVVYTADETGMLVGGDDGVMQLWSFEIGQPVRQFVGHSSRVTSISVSLDGKMAVSGGEDNAVIVWDIATGAILHRFTGHTSPIYSVAFAPDNVQVLSASWDISARLWDLNSGAQVRQFNGDAGGLNAVAYSPDGKRALSGATDNTIMLWDVATGAEIYHLEGHTGAVNAVAFSPDGQFALSGADDMSMILWNLDTGEIIRRLGGAESDVGHSDAVWTVAFSPDGQTVASGSRDNTLILWNTDTGEMIHRLFGHTFRVAGAAFSPDGTMLISGGLDNILILWDVETGEEIRRFEGHTDWIRSVAFSPDSETILSSSADNTLILWDVDSGARLRQFEGHTAQVYSVAFSPDARYAVSGSADTSIIIWDVEAGVEVRRYTGHTDDVRSVTFSPDGQFVLSGSGDGSMRLWQVNLSLDDLFTWVEANRYIRELTCAERDLYHVEPLCVKPTAVVPPGSV